MNLLDVNVLVALARPDHPHHARARAWWSETAARGETATAPDLAWVGFLRVLTHPRIFEHPSEPADAVAFVEAMHDQPAYLPWRDHGTVLDLCGRTILEAGVRANLVPDAYLAAAARSLGAALVTFDRGLRRYDGLRIIEP